MQSTKYFKFFSTFVYKILLNFQDRRERKWNFKPYMLNEGSGISEVVSLKLLYFYGFVKYVSSFQDIDNFIYSEKVTKFCGISTNYLTGIT